MDGRSSSGKSPILFLTPVGAGIPISEQLTNESNGSVEDFDKASEVVELYINHCTRMSLDPILELILALSEKQPTKCSLAKRKQPLNDSDMVCVAAALKDNTTIIDLDLDSNEITKAGAIELATVLKENRTLTALSLANNPIGDEGCTAIANAIKKNPGAALKTLLLPATSVGSSGCTDLGKLLSTNTSITNLNIQSNEVDDIGCSFLAHYIKSNKTLQILDLRSNKIGDDGASSFGELLTTNHSITELDLGGNQIGDKGAIDLVKGLNNNASLKKLNLRANNIQDRGIIALSEKLKHNKGIEELYLGNNRAGEQAIIALADALRENVTLKVLDLQGFVAGVAGTVAIAEALKVNRTLERLILEIDATSAEGRKSLAEALHINRTIQEFDLGDNANIDADDEFLSSITRSLKRNQFHSKLSGSGYDETAQLEDKIARLENEMEQQIKQKQDELQKERSAFAAQQQIISKLEQQLQEEQARAEAELRKERERARAMEAKVAEYEREIRNMEEELNSERGKTKDLEARMAAERRAAEQNLHKECERAQVLQDKLDQEKLSLEATAQQLNNARAKLQSLEASLGSHEENEARLRQMLDSEVQKSISLQQKVQEGERALLQSRIALEAEKKRIEELGTKSQEEIDNKLAAERAKQVQLEQELADNQDRLGAMQAEILKLQRQLADNNAMVKRTMHDLELERAKAHEMEDRLAQERNLIAQTETELQQERNRVHKLESELNGERQRMESLLREEKERAKQLERTIQEKQRDLVEIQNELESERQRVLKAERSIEELSRSSLSRSILPADLDESVKSQLKDNVRIIIAQFWPDILKALGKHQLQEVNQFKERQDQVIKTILEDLKSLYDSQKQLEENGNKTSQSTFDLARSLQALTGKIETIQLTTEANLKKLQNAVADEAKRQISSALSDSRIQIEQIRIQSSQSVEDLTRRMDALEADVDQFKVSTGDHFSTLETDLREQVKQAEQRVDSRCESRVHNLRNEMLSQIQRQINDSMRSANEESRLLEDQEGIRLRVEQEAAMHQQMNQFKVAMQHRLREMETMHNTAMENMKKSLAMEMHERIEALERRFASSSPSPSASGMGSTSNILPHTAINSTADSQRLAMIEKQLVALNDKLHEIERKIAQNQQQQQDIIAADGTNHDVSKRFSFGSNSGGSSTTSKTTSSHITLQRGGGGVSASQSSNGGFNVSDISGSGKIKKLELSIRRDGGTGNANTSGISNLNALMNSSSSLLSDFEKSGILERRVVELASRVKTLEEFLKHEQVASMSALEAMLKDRSRSSLNFSTSSHNNDRDVMTMLSNTMAPTRDTPAAPAPAASRTMTGLNSSTTIAKSNNLSSSIASSGGDGLFSSMYLGAANNNTSATSAMRRSADLPPSSLSSSWRHL